MATLLDVRRKEVERLRVEAAKAEMDMKIMEKEEEIQRLRDHMAIQAKRSSELAIEIEKLREELVAK